MLAAGGREKTVLTASSFQMTPGDHHLELRRPTILHVDDYAPGRYARTKLLQDAGFNVKEAAAGMEALRLAAEWKPQLAVLDVNLPDISGFEVCRRLKQDPATAGIVVLQLSATNIRPSDQVQGLEMGADAYLVDPVDPQVLVATIRAMLRAQQAEQALCLITAQEEERRRIARELHDDIGQKLAALAIEVDVLGQKHPQGELGASLSSVSRQVHAISDDVGTMSRRLHPSVLEDLGLESALAELGGEFRRIHKMKISASCCRLTQKLPIQVSTALYRVAQEALRNSSKHAPGAPVILELTERDGRVLLAIEDGGPGFHLDGPRDGRALGLINMQERARQAGGTFSIHTRPQEGTRIEVSVPQPSIAAHIADPARRDSAAAAAPHFLD